ncbi:MAG: nucleotidyltransferase family protein [Cyclobacteriaceae bacterium]
MEKQLNSLEKIKQTLRSEMPFLKNRFHINYLGVFGSYVRNEQHELSDIDILVDFDPDFYPGYLDFLSLEEYLSDLLKTRVDLVTISSLQKRVGQHILDEVVAL